MANLIDYIKDKIYYVLGATILIIVILVLLSSCQGGRANSYSAIENNMVSAAEKYYSSRKDKLPKENGGSVQVTIGTLIDAELLSEVKDPKNKKQTCEGYVQVKKVEDDYAYTPFLSCKGNYEPKYLSDVIKNSGLDEYGNGIYEMNGEYVYRGDDVNNYVSFNNQLWRILRLNNVNETKIILNDATKEKYTWETSYNVNKKRSVGITSDYLNTNMRKTLLRYYNEKFSEASKSIINIKTWCIGGISVYENFNKEKECSKTKENEYVGLMNVSDYKAATLDATCNSPTEPQCTNRNYLINSNISTWTMNSVESNDYQMVRFIRGNVIVSNASKESTINPVIYLSQEAMVSGGDGSYSNPYLIK